MFPKKISIIYNVHRRNNKKILACHWKKFELKMLLLVNYKQ